MIELLRRRKHNDMTNTKILAAIWLLITAISITNTHAAKLTTAYFPAEGKTCKTTSHNKETGDTEKRCPGPAGYSLVVIESDDRASISLVTAKEKTLPLNFWDIVTPTFSTLGPKVEWRLMSNNGAVTPVAIIARVNTVDQADVAAPKPRSFLVVARIHNETACVTAKVSASERNANELARSIADTPDRACLPPIKVGK